MLDSSLIESLINSNRDIDINAKATNRADFLKALESSGTALDGGLTRATNSYRNTLAGEATQADSDFRLDQMNENARTGDQDFDLKSWLANEGAFQVSADGDFRNAEFNANQQNNNRQSNLQEWLAAQGVNIDSDKLAETARQFKLATGLDLLRLLESQRQFDGSLNEDQRQHNNQMGFNYTNLGVNSQNSLMNSIMQMFPGL